LLTSTETELAEKQKKAEYNKQYSMKRKFLMQQQASTSSETHIVVMRIIYIFERITCMSSLRHIHDPVFSSLKMKGIRLLF
jgi:hypothetical protein